jgi:integrase
MRGPAEVTRLLESVANDPPLHLYLTLAVMTGARRGQLLALRWVDVDLVGGNLSIQRSVVEGPQSPVRVPTKTRRSYRVALDQASLEHLRDSTSEEPKASSIASCSRPTPGEPALGYPTL